MASRVEDLYFVELANGKFRMFHHIANDSTQLGSNVIRAFKSEFQTGQLPGKNEIAELPVDFHAHTSCALGVKMGLWKKAGYGVPAAPYEGFFRDSGDYGTPSILVSNDWWVWQIGVGMKRVGQLQGRYAGAEVGIVFSPPAIVTRLETGSFGIVYPAHTTGAPNVV